ncbi:MAG: hypothetical protein OEL89_00145 [Candidatus Peregrinibacteria bacterium]|nr:hypothetical protein [Candidatus Peregrinibacteria bacterium]
MTFKNIKRNEIHVPVARGLYHPEFVKSDNYLCKMCQNVYNLPPIQVIDVGGDQYVLSNGYHRLSVFDFLGMNDIIVEVLNE